MLTNIKVILLSAFFLTTLLISCKKDDDTNASDDAAESLLLQQNADAQSLATQIFALSMEASGQYAELDGLTGGEASDRGGCPTKTFKPYSTSQMFPATLTLDFGTGCTTSTGKTVSGKVTLVFSGQLNQSGTTITITLANFSYQGFTVSAEGLQAIVSVDSAGKVTYTLNVPNMSIATPQGESFTFTGTIAMTRTEGQATTYQTDGETAYLDDVYAITVNGSGTNPNGKTYTCTTLSPLVKSMDCDWIVSGKLEVKVGNLPKKTLDFGDGSCDDQATLSTGPTSKTITLP